MQSSVQPSEGAAAAAVARAIVALERACLAADAAFLERRWNDVHAALAAQGTLTEELRGLFETAPETAPARDAKVAQRLAGVLAFRGEQLRRMEAYRDEIGARLRSIGKVRAFSRSIGRRPNAARVLDGQY